MAKRNRQKKVQGDGPSSDTGGEKALPLSKKGALSKSATARKNNDPWSPGTLISHMDLLSAGNNGNIDHPDDAHTAPLFTGEVGQSAFEHPERFTPFTQYGLLAGDAEGLAKRTGGYKDIDPRIFYNVSTPSSAFICGSQGSGKSHSLSCLLEAALVRSPASHLPRPLTGIVFHYDTFVSDTAGSPCEAAYLSSHHDVSVRVLCAPTNIGQIQRIYNKLSNVTVEELRINESDLNTRRMMDLMAVRSGSSTPLYLSVINRILRELRIEQQKSGSTFDYSKFKRMVDAEALTDAQLAPLKQRLETLESFMNPSQAMAYTLQAQIRTPGLGYGGGKGKTSRPKPKPQASDLKREIPNNGTDWAPKAGLLTIVDLSCPCVTAEMACSLFGICLSLFLEQSSDVGRIIALDEAHKFMTESDECQALTESLLATIRLQRHLGARVIISTQEPTISSRLLDLCSMTIVHRFTSPDWLQTLRQHLAGASLPSTSESQVNGDLNGDRAYFTSGIYPLRLNSADMAMDLFSRIISLQTGEALLFAPSAIIGVKKSEHEP